MKLNVIIAFPEKRGEKKKGDSLKDKVKYALECANAGSTYHEEYLSALKSKLDNTNPNHKNIITLLENK